MSALEQLMEIPQFVVWLAFATMVGLIVVVWNQRNRITDQKAERSLLNDRLERTTKESGEAQKKVESLEEDLKQTSTSVTRLEAELKHERDKLAEQGAFLENAKQLLGDTFVSLSSKALQTNREELLKDLRRETDNTQNVVGGLVKPINDDLRKLESSHSSLNTRIEELSRSTAGLGEETNKLITALRRPEIRGQWGELQLEQCFELAGLQRDIHFRKQPAISDGQRRPDYVVNLPGERHIVVDAKTPIDAWLSALDAENDQERSALWKRHAGNVKKSAQDLSAKRYWDAFPQSPEFVVMFIPSDAFYSAALQHDSGLLQYSVNKRVIIATPTNLIALLLIIHMGWQEVKLAREADKIRRQGHELYRQAGTLVDRMLAIRRGLVSSVKAYDGAVGSLNRYFTRVETFSEPVSISSEELPEFEAIAMDPRMPNQRVMLAANNTQDQDDRRISP